MIAGTILYLTMATAGLTAASPGPITQGQPVPQSRHYFPVDVQLRDTREHGRRQRNGLAYDDFAAWTAKTNAWPVGTVLLVRTDHGAEVTVLVADNNVRDGMKPDNAVYLSPRPWLALIRDGKPGKWEIAVR